MLLYYTTNSINNKKVRSPKAQILKTILNMTLQYWRKETFSATTTSSYSIYKEIFENVNYSVGGREGSTAGRRQVITL